MKVDLYTTHCPKCAALEKKLAIKKVQYTEHTDVEEMLRKGFKSAPMLVVDDEELSFGDAIKWVNSLEETNGGN